MINFVFGGDLLEAKEDVIVQQVNCQSAMRSGVALQIRNKYPKVYDDYMLYLEKYSPEEALGTVHLSYVGNNKYVANMFSQLHYGYDGQRYTNYEALYSCLEYVKNSAKRGKKSVAIPYGLGSDRGGANWEIVLCMIDKIFWDYDVTIYKLDKQD